MKEDEHALPVPDVLPGTLLAESQQARRCQGKEFLQSVFDIVMTTEGKETTEQLVDSHGQAVDVVAVPLQLRLIGAALAPGKLGNRDGGEHHQQARGEILLVCLHLGARCLPLCGEQGWVHLAGVPTGTGQLGHQTRLVWRTCVAVEVLVGRSQEGDSFLQLS